MFDIILHEPKIAPNTGSIIRLVANNGFKLHLIEPLGFDMDEKKLRRAGLDYIDMARVQIHQSLAACLKMLKAEHPKKALTVYAVTAKGTIHYSQCYFKKGDILLFGSETHGLPDDVMEGVPADHRLRIPMMPESRSLNLANAVSIVSYEAWRQMDFEGAV